MKPVERPPDAAERTAPASQPTDDLDRIARLPFRFSFQYELAQADARGFYDASHGLERGAIVDCGAGIMAESGVPYDLARQALWRDLTKIYGWRAVADLDAEGAA